MNGIVYWSYLVLKELSHLPIQTALVLSKPMSKSIYCISYSSEWWKSINEFSSCSFINSFHSNTFKTCLESWTISDNLQSMSLIMHTCIQWPWNWMTLKPLHHQDTETQHLYFNIWTIWKYFHGKSWDLKSQN